MPDVTSTWGQSEQDLPFIAKKDLLTRYRMRIEGVQSWRESEGYDETWERLRDIYRLKSFAATSDDDRIVVAVAFATINVIEPSIAINHPKITVTATNEHDDDQAVIAEAAVNYWWRHHNYQPAIRRAAKDYLVYGLGWLKVGYRYVEGEQQLSQDQLVEMHANLSAQADQFAQQNPSLAPDLPSDAEIADNLPTHESVVVEDRPFVERISPFDVFVDPDATCMEDMRWMAQRVVRPIEEVKSDKRFNGGARRKLESDGSVMWQNEKSNNYVEAEAGRITLWEFYDVVRRTMCVFTENSEAFLVDPTPFPYTYGLPFEMVRDYDVPDQFYPIGELEALEPLQDELNETRTAMVRARKKDSIRKYIYHSDAFTPNGINALRSDIDNSMAEVEPNTPLVDAMIPLQQTSMNPELYHHSDVIVADFDRVSGVSEYQRGEIPETRRTATEANIIQDAANSRAADKLATIEAAAAAVGRKLIQLAQEYMTGDQTLRKTGIDGSHVWGTFTREDIQGEFDFSVEAGSMQPINEQSKRSQALQMLQAVGPLLEAGVIDARALAEHVLRDGFGLRDASKFITPAPDANQPKQPDEKLVETMAYKDAPPDIQRQMEQQAGFTPSALGMVPTAAHEAAVTEKVAPKPPPAPPVAPPAAA